MGLGRDLDALRDQLEAGSIRRGYSAILAYMSRLRSEFAASPGLAVSGLYQGTFDMTYFALFPPALKARDLKLAVVFDYESFRIQVWLAARNRAVQRKYFALLGDNGWDAYPLVEPASGVDAITVADVASGLEIQAEEELTQKVRAAVAAFTSDLERFLNAHDAGAE